MWLNFNDDAYSGYTIDNSGQVAATLTVASAFQPSPPPQARAGLLAPFTNGTQFHVIQGYYNNASQTPDGCHIGQGPDHCRNQLFGLDLLPSASDGANVDVLMPVEGRIAWVSGDNAHPHGCIGFWLVDHTNLTVCHFATYNFTAADVGQVIPRGCKLGTMYDHVHLNIDDRRTTSYLPIPFTGPLYALEGQSLAPNHDGQGSTVTYAGHTYVVDWEEYQGLSGTSTNVPASCS